jgi:MoxR-like ATPase
MLHDKIMDIRDELRACLLERESTIDNALLALISREHFLQLGPPGTAKSLLTRALCHRIDNSRYVEKVFNQTTTPDELYGPIDLMAYANQGVYQRRSHKTLLDADIYFADEVFKGNPVILNSMLAIMNERIFDMPGEDTQSVPLVSMFAASNEVPADDDGLGALNDRFLLREVVSYISDEQNFVSLLTQPMDICAGNARITLEELQAVHQEILQVKGTPEALQALLTLRHTLAQEGIQVSDRKWRQCAKLLKAKAWYEGEASILVEHIACLAHALWTDPKDAKTVQRIVYSIACPLNVKALEILDMAQEVYATLPKDTDSSFTGVAENILQQIGDQYRLLQSDLSSSALRDTTTVDHVLNKLASMHKAVSTAVFKNMNRLSL